MKLQILLVLLVLLVMSEAFDYMGHRLCQEVGGTWRHTHANQPYCKVRR
jgi:hypothetical protein